MNSPLHEFASAYLGHGLTEIKLKDLLALRSPDNLLRNLTTMFPPISIGSVTLVDQIVLLCLDELVRPDSILELGTFQGFTTHLLAKNSSARSIYSVDLPPTDRVLIDQPDAHKVLQDGDYNDNFLRDIQNRSGEIYLGALTDAEKQRIRLIKQDSTELDFVKSVGNIEFAFIDGGHHYDVVRSDTEKTLGILKQGVIVWHDFASGIHSDVTRFLHERSKHTRIFHVLGSLCAFELIGL